MLLMTKIFTATMYYELLLFFRDRKSILHSVGFFIIVTILFPIALAPHPDLLKKFAPGILWAAALLACLLALESWLRHDLENHALEQLLLSPCPLAWLMTSKIIAFWLVITLPLLLITPLLGLLLHLSGQEITIIELSFLTGTPAVIAIGATCKTLVCSLPQQGALLGLLMLPLTVPILIIGINTLIQFNLNLPVISNLAFLSGVSLLCLCCLPTAIATILRWSIEDVY